MPTSRPVTRWAPALLCVAAFVLSATGGAAAGSASTLERLERQRADTRADLSETRTDLEKAREELGDVKDAKQATLAELQAADTRRAELQAELDRLTMRLDRARDASAAADARLERTTAELTATRDRLEEARARLDDLRQRLAERARASYMYGRTGRPNLASALVDMGNVNRFRQAARYVERVVANDHEQIALVANLKRRVEAEAEQLAALQRQREQARAAAADRRERVAALVADQRRLRDQAAAEAERQRRLLAQLRNDKRAQVALINSLESESVALQRELARIAEQERQAEAARRRAEARARQRAQEAAARRAEEAAEAPAPASGSEPGSGSASTEAPASPSGQASGFHMPASGPLTSGFGYRTHPIFGTTRLHAGVDLAGSWGSPVYAAKNGVVVSAGWRGGYGNTVVISHGDGLATLYAHQSNVGVSAGQHVSRGQLVGRIGCSGSCTGPHLHFEVRVNGEPRDPMPYL